MVLGYHATFGAYGFWLPNDPRGSGSCYVGHEELYRLIGPATLVAERSRSRASVGHDRAARAAAKALLPRPPVVFNEAERRVVGEGFGRSFTKGKVIVWACAVMADHVHVVFARHRVHSEQIVTFMKGTATTALIEAGLHPFLNDRDKDGSVPKCWAEGQWIVYLDTIADIERSIRYVEGNPEKSGLPRQTWSFVQSFDGMIL